jgi:hypothetical protein
MHLAEKRDGADAFVGPRGGQLWTQRNGRNRLRFVKTISERRFSSRLSLVTLAASAIAAVTFACTPAKEPSASGNGASGSSATSTDAGADLDATASMPSTTLDTRKEPSQEELDKAALADGGTIASKEPGRTKEDIARVVSAKRPEARACFDEAAKKNPGMPGGTVTVTWTIDPAGVVKDVKVDTARTTVDNVGVGNCIAAIIGKFSFPASAKKLDTHAAYPFNFKAHAR